MPLDLFKDQASSTDFDSIIAEASEAYNIEPELIRAVIKTESNFNPNAVSSKGARGPMQLMAGTAKDMGVRDITNPKENIMAGTKYLRQQLDRFDNDRTLALSAYNAGPGNVEKYGGIPPFRETQEYIDKVSNHYNEYKETANPLDLFTDEEAISGKDLNLFTDEVQEDQVPEWAAKYPNLYGIYGAGKGLLEQAVRPTVETLGAVGGSLFGSPLVGGALGYGMSSQVMDILENLYAMAGGEKVEEKTVVQELIDSGIEVGTAIAIGKGLEFGSLAAARTERFLFSTLPERLYASATKMPLTKKWIKLLPGHDLTMRRAAVQEGLAQKIPPSGYGVKKIEALEREVLSYIDDITNVLDTNPKNKISVKDTLERGLKKAYERAKISSDPVGARKLIDGFAEKFRAHGESLTPSKANAIKRQLYTESKWSGNDASILYSQTMERAKKGVANDLMKSLEKLYPELKSLNRTDAARIHLKEAIETAAGRGMNANVGTLGSKVLLRAKTWPLAIFDATVGHPQVKARLAFALARANPTKYSKFVYPEMPAGYVPNKQKLSKKGFEKETIKYLEDKFKAAEKIGSPLLMPSKEYTKSTRPLSVEELLGIEEKYSRGELSETAKKAYEELKKRGRI